MNSYTDIHNRHPCSGPPATIPDGYRELKLGEMILRTDEYWTNGRWYPRSNDGHGVAYNTGHCATIRKLPELTPVTSIKFTLWARNGSEDPFEFGLFANWGTGNKFIPITNCEMESFKRGRIPHRVTQEVGNELHTG